MSEPLDAPASLGDPDPGRDDPADAIGIDPEGTRAGAASAAGSGSDPAAGGRAVDRRDVRRGRPVRLTSSLRERRGRWVLGAAVVVILLVVVALVALRGGPATPSGSATMWSTIMAGATDETVPKDVALEAFAYVYDVDIPGVTLPDAVKGADVPTSGSGVTRWVRAHWDELTPDQQAVIDRLTTPQPGDLILPVDAAGATGEAPFELAIARPRATSAPAPDLPADALVTAMTNELAADITHVATLLHTSPIPDNSTFAPNSDLEFSDQSGGNAVFVTTPVVGPALYGSHYEPCHITAYKEAWSGESPTASGGVSPRLHELLEHEVIHCYQNVAWGDLSTGYAIPKWITEGSAFYLAQTDTGVAEAMLPDTWTKGWFDPELPLTNRSYDAFGYYNLLAQKGRDLWSLMEPAWKAAAASGQRSNAYIAVLKGDGPDVRDAWAPSYLREAGWSDPWITTGFGLPPDAQATRHEIQALPDPGATGSLLSRSNTVLKVTDSAGEVVTVDTTGLASAHDEGADSALAFTKRKFCVQGDCVCPPGTRKAGEHEADQTMMLPFMVALNAPLGGSTWSVTGASLDDLCGKETPPPTPAGSPPAPAPGPCQGACPGSNGDPHLTTVNHYTYDFQAAGEFTLLRSADGALEIQGRQEPYPGRPVSTNTAIAAHDAGHRVGVYVVNGALQARLDGAPIDPGSGTTFDGGRIAAVDNGFEIDFPDGTRLMALSVGEWGIHAVVIASPSLASDGVGLLGVLDPAGIGLPALPDGTRLPPAISSEQRNQVLYGEFADAWRVTDATSLFDYDPGTSTATYTQRDFPPLTQVRTYGDLSPDEQAAGDAACGAITDPTLHADCAFDVSISGDAGFATGYSTVQTMYDSGIAPAASPTATASVPSPSSSPVAVGGAIDLGPAMFLNGYLVGPNDRVYASIQVSDSQSSIIEVDPTSGSIVARVDVRTSTPLHYAAGSIWAAGLDLDANGNACNVTRFDAQTLAKQATIAIPCTFDGVVTASDGEALWFADTSNVDKPVLRRLDPDTNQPGTSVPLPILNRLVDSQGSIFLAESDQGVQRLATGAATFEPIGTTPSLFFPGGTGAWIQSGSTAQYVGGPTPVSLQIGGSLLAGDVGAAYVAVPGANGGDEVWRYPADGTTPTPLTTAPTLGGQPLDVLGDPMPAVGPDGLAKLWLLRPGNVDQLDLVLDWVPLP